MMRGINHENIFRGPEDMRVFLKIIRDLKAKPLLGNSDEDWFIICYVLMGNHFHLFIKVGKSEIGEVLKKIACAYVLYYNNKYGRDGHLFKERFKSEPCEDDAYFITLLRYIHQNPLKAHLVNSLSNYEFSSWHEFIGDGKNRYSICNTAYTLERIDLATFKELVAQPLSEETKCLEYEEIRSRKLSDEEMLSLYEEETGSTNMMELGTMNMEDRKRTIHRLKEGGCSIRQLSEHSGLSIGTLSRLLKSSG